MNFTTVITDSPSRNNKSKGKSIPWGQIKQWAKSEIKDAFGLTNLQTEQIHITQYECDLTTGWSKVVGWTNDNTVGTMIDGQTI